MKLASLLRDLRDHNPRALARAISLVEENDPRAEEILAALDREAIGQALVLGITGPPGAGKSTLIDQIISQYRGLGQRVGVIAIDPSSPLSGGALLGDRIRMMRHSLDRDVVMRSMASRGRLGGVCAAAGAAVRIMASSGCSPVIIETVGVGQSEMDIIRLADLTVLVLAPGLGDEIQAMKAGLLEVADLLLVNKSDCPGAEGLAMDLENMAQQRRELGGRPSEVLTSVAATGAGVEELLAAVTRLDRENRRSGEQARRRKNAYELEVLEWSLELLKPRLHARIVAGELDQAGDPRRQALRMLGAFPLSEN